MNERMNKGLIHGEITINRSLRNHFQRFYLAKETVLSHNTWKRVLMSQRGRAGRAGVAVWRPAGCCATLPLQGPSGLELLCAPVPAPGGLPGVLVCDEIQPGHGLPRVCLSELQGRQTAGITSAPGSRPGAENSAQLISTFLVLLVYFPPSARLPGAHTDPPVFPALPRG